MRRTIGVLVMEHIAVGLVEDNKVVGPLAVYPQGVLDVLAGMPAESIGDCIKEQIESVAKGEKIDAIGLGFPGVIRHGVVEDSPQSPASERLPSPGGIVFRCWFGARIGTGSDFQRRRRHGCGHRGGALQAS